MVESNIFDAEHRVMLVIASPGPRNNYLSSVFDDAKRTVKFGERYGFETHQLIDKAATVDAINLFFAKQDVACLEHKMRQPKGKYLFLVCYSGHGALLHGTNHVLLPDAERDFVCFQLEIMIRNFRNTHPDNSFIFGVFDCCRNVEGLGNDHPLVVVELAKGSNKSGKDDNYIRGRANMCMVFGCAPTRSTLVSDRVTYALFDYLEKRE
jgi:hypothetical protein